MHKAQAQAQAQAQALTQAQAQAKAQAQPLYTMTHKNTHVAHLWFVFHLVIF